MVLTVSSMLFPVIGLVCHRRRQRWMSIVADLIPASRNQNHMALPYTIGAFVCCADGVHRIPRQRS